MIYNVTMMLGDGNDSVMIDVPFEADSLEEAIRKGNAADGKKLFARGVTWIDGKARVVGVNEV